ncbi:MAG: tetratricopeptide repeat protein [Bacteroidaceae bacterium]
MRTHLYITLYLLLLLLAACHSGRHSDPQPTRANALFDYGQKKAEEGKADSAVIYFRRSLSALEGTTHYELQGTVNIRLAEVLWLHNYYDRAIHCYEQALEAGSHLTDKTLTSQALRGIGKCHLLKNEFEKARAQMGKAYGLRTEIQDPEELARLYNNLSVVCSEMGDQEQALQWNIRSIELTHDTLLRFRNIALRADLCFKTAAYDSACHYARLGLQSPDIYVRTSCAETLYSVAGETLSADTARYLSLVASLNDTIKSTNQTAEIGDAEMTLKQEQINWVLNRRSPDWLYWLIAIALLLHLATLAFVLYRRKKTSMKWGKNTTHAPQTSAEDTTPEAHPLEQEQMLIQKGRLLSEVFVSGLPYQTTLQILEKNHHLTYKEQQRFLEAIADTYASYLDDLTAHVALTREEGVLCCLCLLKMTYQQCAACKNVSENAIRTQKSRIKNKMTQAAPYRQLFDTIFARK